jgi:hypothetical protein
VYFLDNNFHDPDLDRYLETYRRYEPDIAILGDAYSPEQAYDLDLTAAKLRSERSDLDIVIVPKCPEAFDILEDDIILGYPVGYSELDPFDYSTIQDWRDRQVHILGGNPKIQYEAIQTLTQPTLTQDPPADIIGADWNGMILGAWKGEYWSPHGWQPADHLSIRETVEHSLDKVKQFWQGHGLWPDEEPIDQYGPAVQMPDMEIFMDRGGDPIPCREALEQAYVEEYDEVGTVAFESEAGKNFLEYRSDLLNPR